MKKINILTIVLLVLLIVGCKIKTINTLNAPTDFNISDEIISFSKVDNATYKALITNNDTGETITKIIDSGTSLDSLNLEPGIYYICLEVSLDGNTAISTSIMFEIVSQIIEVDPLEAPTDFRIENGTISYTPITNALHKLVVKNIDTDLEKTFYASSGMSIESLELDYGDYLIWLEVELVNEKASTKAISLSFEDPNVINSLASNEMLSSKYIKLIGRTYYDEDLDAVMMSQSASGFTIRFKGTSLTADLVATNYDIETKRPYIAIIVDGNYNNPVVISLENAEISDLVLASNLSYMDHEVTVIKRNEAIESFFGLKNVTTDGKLLEKQEKERYIEVLGDSTIAGYGIEVANGVTKTSENTNIMKTNRLQMV